MTERFINIPSVGSNEIPLFLLPKKNIEHKWQIIDYFITLTERELKKSQNKNNETSSNNQKQQRNEKGEFLFGVKKGKVSPEHLFYSNPTKIEEDFAQLDIEKKRKEELLWYRKFYYVIIESEDFFSLYENLERIDIYPFYAISKYSSIISKVYLNQKILNR